MRELSPTLKAAQEAMTIDALVKIVLTHGASSYTYDRTRILERNHPEGPWSQTAKVLLDNGDNALTDLALQGYKGVISYGAVTPAGEEYSATAPLWVIAPRFDSSHGGEHQLTCELSLMGIPNFLALDKASRNYIPDEDDTKTIETILTEMLTASLGCFSHCKAYDVVVDSRDSLINTYKPKDSLRIYKGNSRLAIAKKLLGCTKCVMLAKADGKLHILVPTISGEVYASQYSLESGHTFFSKAYRKALVIPNYIYASSPPPTVPNWVTVTSDPYSGEAKDQTDIDKFGARKHTTDFGAGNLGSDAECAEYAQIELDRYIALHDPYYEGVATDPDSIAALATDGFNGEIRAYWQASFESDDEAKLVAEAMLAKVKLNAEMGAADVPLNVGSEVYDYIKVTDAREGGSERTGNMGSLIRHYNAEEAEWRMTFSLGQRPEAVDVMAAIEEDAPYFGRLIVDNLYAKNILADALDMYWIDPDGTIDLSKIGDNLDNLPDGEVFARVKTLHLDAGEIKLDEHILYKAGYNPTTKFDLDIDTLDEIPEGLIYQRVKSAALTAGGLVILDNVYVDWDEGTYGLVKATDISAGHILLSSVEQTSSYRTVTDTEKEDWASGIQEAIAAAAGAQETADGKILSFYQDSAPTSGMSLGDFWIDTNDKNKIYRYNGTSWVLARDTDIAQAISAAAGAQATADGKVVTFYQDSAPTAEGVGDLWVDTNDNNKLYRWNGSSWAQVVWMLDAIQDGTYSKVLTTDISAGHIKLSEVIQTSSYRTVTDANKTTWTGKPEDMDEIGEGSTYGRIKQTDIYAGHIKLWTCEGDLGDIDGDLDDISDGSTYGKLRKTDIDAGHIKLTSYTRVVGEWYNESGVEIDATHGINIYGKANALTTRATKTGTIQCYVGSDGKIYAGAGAVSLDSGGIIIKGAKLTLKDSGGGHAAELYVDTSGNLRLDPWGYAKVKHILPVSDYTYWLGNVDNAFRRIYGNPVVPTTGDATEGCIKVRGASTGDIYVYSNGGWRPNT
ncbi:hypothetical protein ES703_24421 [subsurface metagenome]